jgi:hypothetical protein
VIVVLVLVPLAMVIGYPPDCQLGFDGFVVVWIKKLVAIEDQERARRLRPEAEASLSFKAGEPRLSAQLKSRQSHFGPYADGVRRKKRSRPCGARQTCE